MNNYSLFLGAAAGGVLRNFAEFTGKHLCQNIFFNKVAGLRDTPYLAVFSPNAGKYGPE